MIGESRAVSGLVGFFRFLEISAGDSKTLVYLIRLSELLTASFLSSRARRVAEGFRGIYPARLWGGFDRVNQNLSGSRIGIFHPLFLFPFLFFAFVSMSTYRVSNLGLVSIAAGVISFAIGFKYSKRVRFKEVFLENKVEEIALVLSSVGVFFLILDLIRAGSLPILDPAAKRALSVPYTMLASLTVPGGIASIAVLGKRLERGQITLKEARIYGVGIVLATTFLIGLIGFRTQIIVSILGCGLALYFTGIIGAVEIIAAFFAAFFAISGVGYYRALQEGAQLGFLEVMGKRAGLTLSVYDNLVNRFWVFGVNHGTVALATFSSLFSFIPGPILGPRTIVARMFGVQNISMTSTLYGTVLLDFGIPGIIGFSLILGLIIGMAYKAMKSTGSALATTIFTFLFAYTLVGVETGLVDFNVFMFFLAGGAVILRSRL